LWWKRFSGFLTEMSKFIFESWFNCLDECHSEARSTFGLISYVSSEVVAIDIS
jgi:hypothetical protein